MGLFELFQLFQLFIKLPFSVPTSKALMLQWPQLEKRREEEGEERGKAGQDRLSGYSGYTTGKYAERWFACSMHVSRVLN